MRLADGLHLAGALAYEHSTLRDADATARIDGDSMLGAIGLHYRVGALELVGSVDGGYGWYTSRRQITVNRDSQQAGAAPRLWNIGMALTASYRVPLGTDSYLKPFAGVRGSNVHANAFAEDSRSVFALDVRAQNDVAVSGTFGATLGTSIASVAVPACFRSQPRPSRLPAIPTGIPGRGSRAKAAGSIPSRFKRARRERSAAWASAPISPRAPISPLPSATRPNSAVATPRSRASPA